MSDVNLEMDSSQPSPPAKQKFRILSANPGKRRTEIIYAIWFLVTVPIQGVVTAHLSYEHTQRSRPGDAGDGDGPGDADSAADLPRPRRP